MKSIIDVKNLSFRYKENQNYYDVKDITFHVKRGEWLSIVGHNGSGKSTTVRLIDGLLEAESGEIVIDGQRLTIAGVVALRPAILILDEATSMLDPEGRRELIGTVKGIRKDYDMTVISITHDLEEVAMSDRVLVMKKGEIESTSSPRELFSRNDLDQIGLDDPFANQLKKSLSQNGYDLPENYLTESELEDKLWELL